MIHLALPPTEGALSNELKSAIIDRMYARRKGLLHACKSLKISTARAMAELKADKVFAREVTTAREMLAEWHYEEAISLADKAKGRDDTPAIALQVKTRLTVAEQLLPRLQRLTGGKGSNLHLHQHQGDTFYISEEKRERLQAQRERILKTTHVRNITSVDGKNVRKLEATDQGEARPEEGRGQGPGA